MLCWIPQRMVRHKLFICTVHLSPIIYQIWSDRWWAHFSPFALDYAGWPLHSTMSWASDLLWWTTQRHAQQPLMSSLHCHPTAASTQATLWGPFPAGCRFYSIERLWQHSCTWLWWKACTYFDVHASDTILLVWGPSLSMNSHNWNKVHTMFNYQQCPTDSENYDLTSAIVLFSINWLKEEVLQVPSGWSPTDDVPATKNGVCNSDMPNNATYDRFIWMCNYYISQGFYVNLDYHRWTWLMISPERSSVSW